MIWLTGRQFRIQALTALAALALLAVYLVILGRQIHHDYNTLAVGCQATHTCSSVADLFQQRYGDEVGLVGGMLIGVPALIGLFWGAPLISRELETGTYRVVWSQSVTRTRWLAVKLGVISLVSIAFAGLFSLLLSWAASPFDRVEGNRFASALTFDSRNLVPVGYAVFAFVLGTTVGLLVRRVLPAMALTLVIFVAVQILMPIAIRPHLRPPATATVAFTADTMTRADGIGINGSPDSPGTASVLIVGYTIPGAWVLDAEPRPLLLADGRPVTNALMDSCMPGLPGGPGPPRSPGGTGPGGPDQAGACIAHKANIHFTVSYQPASRYWSFQLIESSLFLALAGALAGFCFWRIRRDLSPR
jgi:ABC-type transport system involved in multi-copper enzyme maturation permease subunit